MAVKVMIPTPLRRFVGDKASVEIEGDNIGKVLAHLTETHSGLRKHLFNDQGAMRNYVNLYLNDEDVRFLQKEQTPVKAGDVLSIVPSIAGGVS